jgi:hypothetical protein
MEMTNLLQLTITFRKSHRQPECALQLVFEDGVFFVWVVHVSLWSAASKMRKRKFVSFIQFFSNVRSSSNPHKKSNEECAPD